ncbi:MAG: outer membrane lipoprotein carrier protein LolA, partial [Actinomycetota bacterium]|nr:outer membrane lipoprotein carrier protein LolA [Actinomycetota bacterium]
GGDGRSRLSLPTPQGEKTFVSDGTTRWAYDSEDRTATRSPQRAGQEPGPAHRGPGGADATDPATASRDLIGSLQKPSNVAVDGTGEVAGRPVYQLVLSPKPGERTLLREVRVAVDGEKRIPLQLTVLTNGSPDPALRAGFDDVTFGPQDPSLFTFTPPPGTTVEEAPDRGGPAPDQRRGPDGPDGVRPGEPGAPNVVGDGWDTVIVAQRPSDQQNRQGQPDRKGPDGPDGGVDLNALGTPVSGPWGSGRQITTAVGSAIIADDGRVAAGAVPPQVLVEALGT